MRITVVFTVISVLLELVLGLLVALALAGQQRGRRARAVPAAPGVGAARRW